MGTADQDDVEQHPTTGTPDGPPDGGDAVSDEQAESQDRYDAGHPRPDEDTADQGDAVGDSEQQP